MEWGLRIFLRSQKNLAMVDNCNHRFVGLILVCEIVLFWILRFAPVPSATKKLFLKKKVRETEGFSWTFQKDFFSLRGAQVRVSARHNNARSPHNRETSSGHTQSRFYRNNP